MFENIVIWNYVYATRFIASWTNEGGKFNSYEDLDDFGEWLKSLDLSKDEVIYIKNLATNGKLELEISAEKWLANKKNSNED